MNKSFSPALKPSLRSFTLLELVVVIIIIAVLAALGFGQYTKIVERSRMSEVAAAFSLMRKLAYAYYYEMGTMVGILASDVGIGSASDQFPNSCSSTTTHYFSYYVQSQTSTQVELVAVRCTAGAGGKSPPYSCAYYPFVYVDPVNGDGVWQVDKTTGSCPSAPSW